MIGVLIFLAASIISFILGTPYVMFILATPAKLTRRKEKKKTN